MIWGISSNKFFICGISYDFVLPFYVELVIAKFSSRFLIFNIYIGCANAYITRFNAKILNIGRVCTLFTWFDIINSRDDDVFNFCHGDVISFNYYRYIDNIRILEVKTNVVEAKPIWPNTYLIFTKFNTTFAGDHNARKLKHFTFCNLVKKFLCFKAKLEKHNALQLLFFIFFSPATLFPEYWEIREKNYFAAHLIAVTIQFFVDI